MAPRDGNDTPQAPPQDAVRVDGPQSAAWTVVLAHGAGTGMDSPLLTAVAQPLAAHGLRVVRFEFPYRMRARREGRRLPPDRAPRLMDAYRAQIDALGAPERLIIGGASMGGRVASMIADASQVAGLICLGYPFHPPRKPETLRTAHLQDLRTPTLILHGTRDPFGKPEEIADYDLSRAIALHWIEDGDHGFKPRKSSGRTFEQNADAAAERIITFVSSLEKGVSASR